MRADALLILALSLSLVGCSRGGDPVATNTRSALQSSPQLIGTGKLGNFQRPLPAFSEVEVAGGLEANLVLGSSPMATVQAESNIQDCVETVVEGNVLKVRWRDGAAIRTRRTPKIEIVAPVLVRARAVEASRLNVRRDMNENAEVLATGASSVRFVGKVRGLQAKLDGASSLEAIKLEGGDVNVSASGGSQITVAGQAGDVDLAATGASQVAITNLTAQQVSIEATGASRVDGKLTSPNVRKVSNGASTISLE